jgi:protein gp37
LAHANHAWPKPTTAKLYWPHWVIVGGESGAGAKTRPMHPDWARSLRDQCQAAGVPFFFKQWGDWVPLRTTVGNEAARKATKISVGDTLMFRMGKKVAGRLLDGREWNEVPGAARRSGRAQAL